MGNEKKDCKIGDNTKVWNFVNLYGCTIGKNCIIASFVEIGKDVVIGNNCKIESGAFIPEGVTIEDNVFIAPHVCFTNDKHPKADGEWKLSKTLVKEGVSIGANSTILCGITIGKKATIGAGSVVVKDVQDDEIVFGEKADTKGWDLDEKREGV